MTRLLLPALLLGFLVSGCAATTTPVPLSEAKQAPMDRVLAFQMTGGDKTATLTVIRDEGYAGGGCYNSVYINKVLAARLDVAEYARFYLEPGEIVLGSGSDPEGRWLCAFQTAYETQREILLKPGEQNVFHLTLNHWGILNIQ